MYRYWWTEINNIVRLYLIRLTFNICYKWLLTAIEKGLRINKVFILISRFYHRRNLIRFSPIIFLVLLIYVWTILEFIDSSKTSSLSATIWLMHSNPLNQVKCNKSIKNLSNLTIFTHNQINPKLNKTKLTDSHPLRAHFKIYKFDLYIFYPLQNYHHFYSLKYKIKL